MFKCGSTYKLQIFIHVLQISVFFDYCVTNVAPSQHYLNIWTLWLSSTITFFNIKRFSINRGYFLINRLATMMHTARHELTAYILQDIPAPCLRERNWFPSQSYCFPLSVSFHLMTHNYLQSIIRTCYKKLCFKA
jgi:hypothetical protein